jgi:hypothetical protein
MRLKAAGFGYPALGKKSLKPQGKKEVTGNQ